MNVGVGVGGLLDFVSSSTRTEGPHDGGEGGIVRADEQSNSI